MRWFVRGDIDGFFGLALDNLVQLLLIHRFCSDVLDFPPELVYGRVLPGVAISLLVGNFYYAWLARRVARREGRDDVCALPYGINTVSLFAYVFLVMLPVKLQADQQGLENSAELAWQAGVLACLGSGVIEFLGSLVAERIRRATPRAALLSTLAGIAIGFISLSFVFQTFAHPVVGLATLGIVLLTYFGRVRFLGNLPGGLVAVAVGTALAWITGLAPVGDAPRTAVLHVPEFSAAGLLDGLRHNLFLPYLSIIIPMGIFNVLGSLQNIESAEAAGDSFPTRPCLAVNGLGTLAAALFGSCFPTTIYIGHPGWKAMGARAGYSALNCIVLTVVCLTGTVGAVAWAIPVDAGMAILLWIGIVISAQAFQATPRIHAPAVVVGLLPGLAAWGALVAKNSLRVAGLGTPGRSLAAAAPDLVEGYRGVDLWIEGAFALEQGFIFTAMILSAATVAIIERRFVLAAAWCALAALLSAIGLMHSYVWTPGDTVLALEPAVDWTFGYALMSGTFLMARWITRPQER